MVAVTIYLGLAVAGLVYAYFQMFYRKLRPGEPPLAPGHFLWGNGKQFTEHAVNFLSETRKNIGDVFTVRFLNQYWTMMLDVHSYERFAREKNFDFDAIQEQVNQNVFGYKLVDARKMISEAGQKVNGKHLYSSLENFAKNLKRSLVETANTDSDELITTSSSTTINNNNNSKDALSSLKNEKGLYDRVHEDALSQTPVSDINGLLNSQKLLEKPPIQTQPKLNDGWCEENLRDLASKAFFAPLFYTIFGRGEPGKEGNFHPQAFHKNFDKFHKYFNFLWLGVPIKFFPKAGEAAGILAQQPKGLDMMNREDCSEYIKLATDFMLRHDQSERDIVCHNLVFLHVNYNTFRAVFWCMYKLMEDVKVMAAVRREVEEVVEAKRAGDDPEADFTAEDVNNLPVVDSFLKEVLRWTSGVFMVRKCLEDTAFTTSSGQTYNIRKGDKVAIYPPVLHHDPEIYESPYEFKYDRFIGAEFFKNGQKIKHPLIAFGSRCPGQKLSMLQIKWFIINFVNSFKFELEEGEKTVPNTSMYGHEILPPTNDVRCRFKEREGACELKFVNNYGQSEGRGLHGISSGNLL
ncbi:prostacyclin synthase [Aplysia californica]|uniref:Prostacyclin synthase n=1 Tax=Aplysia californica TaxID=6500 RepID=A0ABM0K8U3_APLCA|nr:prostacyclin synthase [Aplysia californica]XP_005111571.1 prostacyclin synthase [Aplysia californica]